MKIIFLSPYLSIPEYREFGKNTTGFGLVVRDLAVKIACMDERVDVVTMSAITRGFEYRSVNILKRSWLNLLINVRIHYLQKMMKIIRVYRPPLRTYPRLLFYAISGGYVEKILQRGEYSAAAIHGIGIGTSPFVESCETVGLKYLTVCHGLNSFGGNESVSPGDERYERKRLNQLYNDGLPLVVVSTGIKEDIKNHLGVPEAENIIVIPNGTNILSRANKRINVRLSRGLNSNTEIMLSVGNFSSRKNQVQLVRAFALLPGAVKSKLKILFLGGGSPEPIRASIDQYNLRESIIICGNIDESEIQSYYQQADYTAMVSLSEGFGMSIIEGFAFGLPSLCFKDVHAVKDLFDPKTMLLVEGRTDGQLADGILRMMKTDWDRDYIKRYAGRFSQESMARNYLDIFGKMISL
jgi:glycosyltransferase involved in cell wall biosynthesis